jgi:hypothetical protein
MDSILSTNGRVWVNLWQGKIKNRPWRTLRQVLLTLFVFAVLPLPMSQSDAPPRKMALQNFAPAM